MTPVVVRARGWGWRHGTRKAWAVRDVDLDVAPGERILLLAPSGAGKSTLLAGLAGLLSGGDEEGELLLDGVPAASARLLAVAEGAARTGLLLQDPEGQTILARCGDDVAFGLENHGVPRELIWPRVDAALAAVGFPYPRAHATSRLSGGQRQRLALAGVLTLRPGLLLLDEPTAMLDVDGAAGLRQQVVALLAATGATAVVVDHRVEPWLPHVDRVVVLEPGSGVAAEGPPTSVFHEHREELAAGGIWLPGPPPSTRLRRAPGSGEASPVGGGGASAAPGTTASRTGEASGVVLMEARSLELRRPGLVRPAVSNVDLDVLAGEALCLLGVNGAGKSTLAAVLGGLTAPSSGSLRATPLLAAGAAAEPHRWRPKELVTRIGSVFQEPAHQFVAATVEEELAVGPRRVGVPETEVDARVADLLGRLRLEHLARANPFTLSGGEQRRLSVATMLATRPGVLVLDEPTFGQDARTWAELVGLLIDLLDAGTAVVASTHDAPLVAALSARVLRLHEGVPIPDGVTTS